MKRIILDLMLDVTKYVKDRKVHSTRLLPYSKEYADTYDETKFQKDVRDTLRFVYERSHSFKGYFADVVAHMCVFEFSKAFDLGKTEDILPGDASVTKAVVEFLQTHTEQEVATQVHQLLYHIDSETPFIVVQTPIPLTGPQRHALRMELIERYGRCFPHFLVNKNLLGGLRIFVDGVTIEHSWQARLQHVLSNLYSFAS